MTSRIQGVHGRRAPARSDTQGIADALSLKASFATSAGTPRRGGHKAPKTLRRVDAPEPVQRAMEIARGHRQCRADVHELVAAIDLAGIQVAVRSLGVQAPCLYRTRLARGRFRDAERPILVNNWGDLLRLRRREGEVEDPLLCVECDHWGVSPEPARS
jgi:hypothetical protein